MPSHSNGWDLRIAAAAPMWRATAPSSFEISLALNAAAVLGANNPIL
jgi:hypothetical protein